MRCAGSPYSPSQFAVARGLAEVEPGGAGQHEAVPVGDTQVDRDVETLSLAGEELADLACSFVKHRAPLSGDVAVFRGENGPMESSRQPIHERRRLYVQSDRHDPSLGRGNVDDAPGSGTGCERGEGSVDRPHHGSV